PAKLEAAVRSLTPCGPRPEPARWRSSSARLQDHLGAAIVQRGVQTDWISVRIDESLDAGVQMIELPHRPRARFCQGRRVVDDAACARDRHQEVLLRGVLGYGLAAGSVLHVH